MHRFFSILILVLACLLSSCHMLKEKQYTYKPNIVSESDRICVSKCMQSIKYCQQICAMKRSRSCNCVTSFNTCYTACGGRVTMR